MTTTVTPTTIEDSEAQALEVELFRGLSNDEIQALLAEFEDLTFETGDTIYEAGHESRAIHLLVDGIVELDVNVPGLGERVLAPIAPGSVFGEMSFFHAAPHAATARCLAPTRIRRLSRERFDVLGEENPRLALRITTNAAEILAARLSHTDEWIAGSLTRRHEQEVRESWRSFRQNVMTTFGQPKPFIQVGANLS